MSAPNPKPAEQSAAAAAAPTVAGAAAAAQVNVKPNNLNPMTAALTKRAYDAMMQVSNKAVIYVQADGTFSVRKTNKSWLPEWHLENVQYIRAEELKIDCTIAHFLEKLSQNTTLSEYYSTLNGILSVWKEKYFYSNNETYKIQYYMTRFFFEEGCDIEFYMAFPQSNLHRKCLQTMIYTAVAIKSLAPYEGILFEDIALKARRLFKTPRLFDNAPQCFSFTLRNLPTSTDICFQGSKITLPPNEAFIPETCIDEGEVTFLAWQPPEVTSTLEFKHTRILPDRNGGCTLNHTRNVRTFAVTLLTIAEARACRNPKNIQGIIEGFYVKNLHCPFISSVTDSAVKTDRDMTTQSASGAAVATDAALAAKAETLSDTKAKIEVQYKLLLDNRNEEQRKLGIETAHQVSERIKIFLKANPSKEIFTEMEQAVSKAFFDAFTQELARILSRCGLRPFGNLIHRKICILNPLSFPLISSEVPQIKDASTAAGAGAGRVTSAPTAAAAAGSGAGSGAGAAIPRPVIHSQHQAGLKPKPESAAGEPPAQAAAAGEAMTAAAATGGKPR